MYTFVPFIVFLCTYVCVLHTWHMSPFRHVQPLSGSHYSLRSRWEGDKACDCHISACVFTVPHLRLAKRHRQKRLPADFFLAQVKVPLPCTSASSCCINPQAIISEHVNMVAPVHTPIYIVFYTYLYMISMGIGTIMHIYQAYARSRNVVW